MKAATSRCENDRSPLARRCNLPIRYALLVLATAIAALARSFMQDDPPAQQTAGQRPPQPSATPTWNQWLGAQIAKAKCEKPANIVIYRNERREPPYHADFYCDYPTPTLDMVATQVAATITAQASTGQGQYRPSPTPGPTQVSRPTSTPWPTPRPTKRPTPTRPPTPTPVPTVTVPRKQPEFGPQSGRLPHSPNDGKVETYRVTDVWTRDAVMEAEFQNIYGNREGDWSYGFMFRNSEYDRFQIGGITDRANGSTKYA